MKKLSYLLIVLVNAGLFMLGCENYTNPTDVPFSDPAATSNLAKAEVTNFEDTDSSPFSFFNDCTGENVTGTLYTYTRGQLVADGNGGTHARMHMLITGDAVGETSGIKYKGIATDYDCIISNSSGNSVQTFLIRSVFISQGSSDNFIEETQFRATITPDGEVKAVITSDEFECKG